jgi:uncharacterized membrane protein
MFGFILQSLVGLFDPIGWAVTALIVILLHKVSRWPRVVLATVLVPFVMAGIGYALSDRFAMYPAWFCTVLIEAVICSIIQERYQAQKEPAA